MFHCFNAFAPHYSKNSTAQQMHPSDPGGRGDTLGNLRYWLTLTMRITFVHWPTAATDCQSRLPLFLIEQVQRCPLYTTHTQSAVNCTVLQFVVIFFLYFGFCGCFMFSEHPSSSITRKIYADPTDRRVFHLLLCTTIGCAGRDRECTRRLNLGLWLAGRFPHVRFWVWVNYSLIWNSDFICGRMWPGLTITPRWCGDDDGTGEN